MGVQTLGPKKSGEAEYPSCMRITLNSGGRKQRFFGKLVCENPASETCSLQLDVHI